MIYLFKANYDKVLIGLAAAALAASGIWWWQQQGEVRRLRALPVSVQPAGTLYEPANLKLPEIQAAAWPKVPAQSAGSGWLYEVFTPPVIYYNTLARSFTVAPPMDPGEATAPFGLELLAVKPEQYRLQLVGYFGAPGDYLAAFASPQSPETWLAREGRRFENLGLTLKSFDVKKVKVEHDDAWPVYDIAGLAVLTDEQTGADVVLDSRARKFTDTPLAVLRLPAEAGQPRALHEGDILTEAGATYRIERIQLDPPEVVVVRSTPGRPQPETRVLHPLPTVAQHLPDGRQDKSRAGSSRQRETAGKTTPAQAQPFTDRPATGMVASDQ